MTKDEAINALINLARDIDPSLPVDLSKYEITIRMFKDGCRVYRRLAPQKIK